MELVPIAIMVVVLAAIGLRLSVRREVFLEHERGVRYWRGRLRGILPPGIHWRLTSFEKVVRMDVRPQVITVAGQEVLTADHVSVRLSLTGRLEVTDPVAALTRSASHLDMLHQAAQLAIRDLVARYPLAELLARRGELNQALHAAVAPRARELGLTLHEIGIRDIMLPAKLRDAFIQVVHAERAGDAALVRARSEVAANRALLNAARMLEQNPGLVTMRTLQALAEAGRTPGTTVVFGLPPNTLPLAVRTPEAPHAEPGPSPEEE